MYMTPIHFKECNIIFGADQPEYQPLPAFQDEAGNVVSCWRLSWRERIRLLFTGRLFLVTMTFKAPIQPILPTLTNPIIQQSEK